MTGGGHPSWERLAFWLIALVIGLQVLASVLPRLLLPVIAMGAVAVVLRLVWFFTGRY